MAFLAIAHSQELPMSYASAAVSESTSVIILPIGRRSPFVDLRPDTLLVLTRELSGEDDSSNGIAEHVHEIGAMAVVA
jgi:hypothetical protein